MNLGLEDVRAGIVACERCPRLRSWCRLVAEQRKPEFSGWSYWGRPVPGFGDPQARLLIVGLAPAAHGGNRTGRVFTGDASGDFLWEALHAVGLADRAASRRPDDGLTLVDTYIAAAVRCAPPSNKPTIEERDTCAPWLHQEMRFLLPTAKAFVVLGGFGWASTWTALRAAGATVPVRPPAARLRARDSSDERCATSDGSGAEVRTTDRCVATCW